MAGAGSPGPLGKTNIPSGLKVIAYFSRSFWFEGHCLFQQKFLLVNLHVNSSRTQIFIIMQSIHGGLAQGSSIREFNRPTKCSIIVILQFGNYINR